jgi:hypothetical protein
MNKNIPEPKGTIWAGIRGLLPDLETLYTNIHAHPELSMQETRMAGLAADRLRAAGYNVTTGIGKTGVSKGSAPGFQRTDCGKPGRRRRARTSDPLAPSGTFPRCSGSSVGPIPSCMPMPRQPAGSPSSRPITTRASHQ